MRPGRERVMLPRPSQGSCTWLFGAGEVPSVRIGQGLLPAQPTSVLTELFCSCDTWR